MGFDIHGMNPVERVFEEEKYPTYNKYSNMDFAERQEIFNDNEGLQSKYFDEMTQRENENPGIYFRNNVWWWRPLWAYICDECDDILNEEDMEEGQSNSGHIISEEKSIAIADRLDNLIDSGAVKKEEVEHMAMIEQARDDNEGKKCSDKGYQWVANYPFDEQNVRDFSKFCRESGGFEIC